MNPASYCKTYKVPMATSDASSNSTEALEDELFRHIMKDIMDHEIQEVVQQWDRKFPIREKTQFTHGGIRRKKNKERK